MIHAVFTENFSDDRKFRKPLMEKKRRARINKCLDDLRMILTKCDPENVKRKNAKLEKADILELTVKYLERVMITRGEPITNSCRNWKPSYYYPLEMIPSSGVNSKSIVGSGSHFSYGTSTSGVSSNCATSCGNEIWRPWR
uniref:Putative transcription factor HES-2a-like protein n=1 Tax=Leptinotarsa decemlineata TaxID=7539 RepID=A0A0K0PQL1_LEPDE|nr:putative transcription factor HES-2a-like protein [Leptinotarsa decemlineata]